MQISRSGLRRQDANGNDRALIWKVFGIIVVCWFIFEMAGQPKPPTEMGVDYQKEDQRIDTGNIPSDDTTPSPPKPSPQAPSPTTSTNDGSSTEVSAGGDSAAEKNIVPAPTSPPQQPVQGNAEGGNAVAATAAAASATTSGVQLSMKITPPPPRHTYQRRGQPMSDAARAAMEEKWGVWKLVDTKERPKEDFYKDYPNRDVPIDKFPSNAWQLDKDYLPKFLDEGIKLVQRAQDAILAEYGKTDGPWEERSKMFHVEKIDTLEGKDDLVPGKGGRGARESHSQGGWTTPSSWAGLQRRLLHAIMTEDVFVFAMGGHSAAAGHG